MEKKFENKKTKTIFIIILSCILLFCIVFGIITTSEKENLFVADTDMLAYSIPATPGTDLSTIDGFNANSYNYICSKWVNVTEYATLKISVSSNGSAPVLLIIYWRR